MLSKLSKSMERSRLSKILSILPTLDIKLNFEQMKILNTNENLFILGRSGTGKTTTTVLRFFCQELAYLAL